jgi:hypothetical protein
MAIVAGFDVHKAQITFDALDLESGEIHRGRIPSRREAIREWVERFDDEQTTSRSRPAPAGFRL